MNAHKPLSMQAFRRMVENLSARQIESLPQDMLPDPIPLEIVDEITDGTKRKVVEDLIWSRSANHVTASNSARENLESSICDALERAEGCQDTGTDELDRLTRQITHNWRTTSGGDDWLDDTLQNLERARRLAADLAREAAGLARAVDVLDRPFVGRDLFSDRVSAARMRAKKVLTRLQSSLGRFHLMEMDIAHGDMKLRHWQCETNLARLRELDEQIATVRARIERHNGLAMRLLRPRVARHQREVLLERLQELTHKRDSLETPISEQELLHWLDVLTDASLLVDQNEWQAKAQRARLLLYRLMNVYCLQQETSAQRVASNPLSQINAREAIDYYLSSEQFMLRYFARKRQEVTLWLAGAAREKLDALDRVRDAILSDYRRSTRMRGKVDDRQSDPDSAAQATA